MRRGSREFDKQCRAYLRQLEEVDNYIYIPDTTRPSREHIITDHIIGVQHHFQLYPTMDHINRYRLSVDGAFISQNGEELFSWSKSTVLARKAFPSIRRF